MIEFLCPEGHKIRCPNEKAGRPAKCPKCGVVFRIPTLEELGLGEPAVADSSLTGEASDIPAAPPSPSGIGHAAAATSAPTVEPPARPESQIEFLCPNGHHLHGPASLQGRAGECPECGSRFRIPVIEESAGDAEPLANPEVSGEELISLRNPPAAAESGPSAAPEPLDFLQVLDAGSAAGKPPVSVPAVPAVQNAPAASGAAGTQHPLAGLFFELWAARGEDSRVEVHLESGSVLSPDGYLRPHSQQDYAVLVTRDPDGCSTVTVVPWGAISKIIVRAMKQVPGEVVR